MPDERVVLVWADCDQCYRCIRGHGRVGPCDACDRYCEATMRTVLRWLEEDEAVASIGMVWSDIPQGPYIDPEDHLDPKGFDPDGTGTDVDGGNQ